MMQHLSKYIFLSILMVGALFFFLDVAYAVNCNCVITFETTNNSPTVVSCNGSVGTTTVALSANVKASDIYADFLRKRQPIRCEREVLFLDRIRASGSTDKVLDTQTCGASSSVLVTSELVDKDRSGRETRREIVRIMCMADPDSVVQVPPSGGGDFGPGYEPIAFSFPTDKINALNKVGISGSGTTQVQLLIGRLIKYIVGFLGTLALCLIIYSGLRFMLSQGDEGKQGEALKMMLWAGIGIVALLGAYSIASFVFGILM